MSATLEERVARWEGQVSEQPHDSLDDKVSRQFVWLVGIQVTTLAAIVSARLARG